MTPSRHGGEPSPHSCRMAWSEPWHDQHATTAAASLRCHVARLCIRSAITSPRIDLTALIMNDTPWAVNGIYQRNEASRSADEGQEMVLTHGSHRAGSAPNASRRMLRKPPSPANPVSSCQLSSSSPWRPWSSRSSWSALVTAPVWASTRTSYSVPSAATISTFHSSRPCSSSRSTSCTVPP